MRAATGTIGRLRTTDDGIQYQTVGQIRPAGTCGSGTLDTLSRLCLAGIIDEGARIMNTHPRVRIHKAQPEFVLVSEEEQGGQPAITIS